MCNRGVGPTFHMLPAGLQRWRCAGCELPSVSPQLQERVVITFLTFYTKALKLQGTRSLASDVKFGKSKPANATAHSQRPPWDPTASLQTPLPPDQEFLGFPFSLMPNSICLVPITSSA